MRRFPLRFSLVAGWLILALVSTASAEDQDAKLKFLKEYEPAARKLQDFYSNIRIRARRVERAYPNRPGTHTNELTYLANGALYRLDDTDRDGKGIPIPGSIVARIVAPGTSYILSKNSSGNFYIRSAEENYQYYLGSFRLVAILPFAPYCLFETTIPEMIREPTCTIQEPTQVTQDGQTLVKLEFEDQPRMVGAKRMKGWLLFSPGDGWTLREFAIAPADVFARTRRRARIEYDSKHQDIPLVKRFTRWSEEGPEKRQSYVLMLEALEVIPGPVAKSEFALAAFGLSDVGGHKQNRLVYYLIWGAILALLVAILFGYLARRKRTAAGTTS